MSSQCTISRISPSRDNGQNTKSCTRQYSSFEKNVSYKSSNGNLDQLDALLIDLKNERQHTKDIDLVMPTAIYKPNDPDRDDLSDSANKMKFVNNASQVRSHLDRLDNGEAISTESHRVTLGGYSNHPIETLKKENIEVTDFSYRSSTQNVLDNNQKCNQSKKSFYIDPQSSSNLSSISFAEDLQEIPLSDKIFPPPGVKVTTTVRTYTYEIPGEMSADESGREKILYKKNKYNVLKSDEADRVISSPASSIVYNTETYSTKQELPVVSCQSQKMTDRIEVDESNFEHSSLPYLREGCSSVVNKTGTYKFDTYHSSTNQDPIYRGEPNSRGFQYQPVSTLVDSHNRHESRDEINKILHSRQKISPVDPTFNHKEIHPFPKPQKLQTNNSSATFEYSSKVTNSNLLSDYNKTTSHQTQPGPFPLTDGNFQSPMENPPQRVDDLMQSFGDSDILNKLEFETNLRKREVETSVATPNNPKIPTINKAGKDVYYPPGHDVMLSKHSEMSSGSAAGGQWAKGSAMYEYESGYKSKSKTKSGGAVVPVCLPLCCAMPCSIM